MDRFILIDKEKVREMNEEGYPRMMVTVDSDEFVGYSEAGLFSGTPFGDARYENTLVVATVRSRSFASRYA